MRHILGMVMMLTGAASLPAAATVNGMASFPVPEGQGLPLAPDLPLIFVQSTEGQAPERTDRPDPYAAPVPPGTPKDAVGVTPAATAALVAMLADGTKQCQRLKDPTLNLDCLSYEYWLAAQNLSWKSGYGSARVALLRAADQLHALAQDNAAPGMPPVRATLGGKPTQRKLTHVKMTPQVAAKAAAIVEETKLVLLRSSEGSEQRRTAYVQVAAIVGSTKVLLRSS